MKKYTILVILLSFLTQAKTTLIHYTKDDNQAYIAQLNPEDGLLINEKRIGASTNHANTLISTHKNSGLIAVLLPGRKSDEVVIYSKESLNELNRIIVPAVNWQEIEGLKIKPIFLSQDDKKLIVISQTSSNLKLTIYEITKPKKIFSRNLGNNPYKISISTDKKYLLFESLAAVNRLFIAIDINNTKTSAILNLGQSAVKTHVFNHSLYISRLRSPKRKKYYAISKIDFSNNKKIQLDDTSSTHFAFVNDKAEQNLFIAGQNKNNKKLEIQQITQGLNHKKNIIKKKIKPLSLVLNEANNKLMVIGHKKLAMVNLEDSSLQSLARIPFDPLTGIMNKDASIGYVQENLGSEVANFDLVNGKLIKSSNAGRVFNQVLVGARKIMIGGSLIELVMITQNSTKNILLNKTEEKLFVINATTNDLTIFDAKTLDKISSLATGFKTYFIYQGKKSQSPILVVGKNRISFIDNKTNTVFLTLKKAKLVGLDKENDLLFYTQNNILHVYDMLSKKEKSSIKNINTLSIYSFNNR